MADYIHISPDIVTSDSKIKTFWEARISFFYKADLKIHQNIYKKPQKTEKQTKTHKQTHFLFAHKPSRFAEYNTKFWIWSR